MNVYSASSAGKAAGMPLDTLQRYLDRKQISLQPCDQASGGSGQPRGFSSRRVTQLAIVRELTSLGIGPSRAAKAAFAFSDRGNPGREIGQLYPDSTTILVGLPRGENRVVSIPPDRSISDVLSHDTTAFILILDPLVARINSHLDSL